jgi:hypothetical protein
MPRQKISASVFNPRKEERNSIFERLTEFCCNDCTDEVVEEGVVIGSEMDGFRSTSESVIEIKLAYIEL